MAKILVVDDEPDLEVLIKQKFRQKIREQHYEFVFAGNGRQAMEQLKAHEDTVVVLSDINMPEMDGLTFLTKLNEQSSLIKTVMVSAYGDMDNIRTAMNRGAFDFITKPINFQDLEVTIEKTLDQVRQIKSMVNAIQENHILRLYVDETVLKFMGSMEFESALTANDEIEATVAFIDICSFTSISENEVPDTVVRLLNSYFDIMVREIIHEKGYVDKFIGDAVLAVFRGEFHLDRAIDACLAIRNRINHLGLFSGNTSFQPQVSIGINSGEMISGNIGSAELRRLDYTVIGDTVNIAQRLQHLAAPNQILIPSKAFETVKESFVGKEVGIMELRNKTTPVKVIEVQG